MTTRDLRETYLRGGFPEASTQIKSTWSNRIWLSRIWLAEFQAGYADYLAALKPDVLSPQAQREDPNLPEQISLAPH